MNPIKKEHPKEKLELHPRNKHRKRYDFKLLTDAEPALKQYVKLNPYNDESIDFANPAAVKMLNKAILKCDYSIENWDIPPDYLCPPIPGRADYIHYIADLLGAKNGGKIPTGNTIKCLDLGVGANCVYPIIGQKEYAWSFIGTDIDAVAIESAHKIMQENKGLQENVQIKLQQNPAHFFEGVLEKGEKIDIVICNPPFHSSWEEAQSATIRKLSNLNKKKITRPVLNFGGKNTELWCEGGEKKFVGDMIRESKRFANDCFWFSSLISKEANLAAIYEVLKSVGAADVRTLSMGQGSKISRVVAWTFLSNEQQKEWVNERW